MSVDFHLHSWYSSDSLASPSDIVRRAAEEGLTAIAITDHDSMRGLDEARAAAEECVAQGLPAVDIVPGVELTAVYGPTREAIHLIALFADPANKALASVMARSRRIERENFHHVVDSIAERGVDIDEESVIAAFGEDYPGILWDEPRYFYLYRYLRKIGVTQDDRTARRFLQKVIAGLHACLEQNLHHEEVLSAAKQAGALAILAHPAAYSFGGEDCRKVLTRLTRTGLGGVEALHRSHSLEDRARFAALARQLDLVISGGSDSHDPVNDPVFGRIGVPDGVLAEIKRRVGQ